MPRNSRRDSILAAPPPGSEARRRQSRRAREARQRKILLMSMSVLGALLLFIVGFGTLRYYYLIPHQGIATVNSHKIIRSDYWKVRRNTLLDRLQQYSFQAQSGQGNSQQIQLAAQSAQNEIVNIRSAPVDPTTLQTMTGAVFPRPAQFADTLADPEPDEAGDGQCRHCSDDANSCRPRAGGDSDRTGERYRHGDCVSIDADAEYAADGDRPTNRDAGADADTDESGGPRYLDGFTWRLC